jgi:hypothetical protein
MRYVILAAALCSAVLTGCSTLSPAQQAALGAEASKRILCSDGEDCSVKWGRALQWTVNNATYSISAQTDSLIQTRGPEEYGTSAGFTITKVPLGGGQSEIRISGACANMFGCIPSLVESRASFVRAVTGE